MAKDPVCKREININKFTKHSEYRGKTYYFCSNGCKFQFEMNPKLYEIKVIIKKKKE